MRWLAYLPALIWSAVLLWLGRRDFGAQPVSWTPPDKLIHFVLYGILGALLAHGWRRADHRQPLLIVLVSGTLVGLYDEWQQQFVPGRSSDPWDWLMDVAGVTVGFLVIALLRRLPAQPSNE
ncbi:MAG: VanZ family protein [Gemmatimonadetes bacterium]|nr:VanZ family protein [Gemmatimonadota bacterium]